MKAYELTIVLPEKATAAKKKSATELVEKIVKTVKGEIKKTDDWGKIPLAYPIAKNNAGNFLHFQLELKPEFVKTLEQKIKFEEDIIRHLLVKKEG
jgi:small subunit ribosomal protein S6